MDVRGLYFITTDAPELGRSHAELAALAAAGGASIIQFREKERDRRRAEAAAAVQAVCRSYAVPFVVNDDLGLAEELDAHGLHLGQSDLAQLQGRRLPGGRALGISVSSVGQARRAVELGADHLGVGPIFATGSKADAEPSIGLDGLREIRAAVDLPLAAIGGISEDNAADVLAAGADAICVISAVAHAPDPLAAARRLSDIARRSRSR